MLARNSRLIQPRRTGVTGSASAARVAAGAGGAAGSLATSLTGHHRSAEALALTAVGRHRAGRSVVLDQVVLIEPFGQLAGLGVPQPHPVPDPQRGGRASPDRGLHL